MTLRKAPRLVCLAALCLVAAPLQAEPGGASLAQGPWQIVALDGAALSPGSAADLSFDGANGVAGGAGCNRLRGRYTQSDAALRIGPEIATTMMACPAPLMTQERRLLELLPQVATHEIDPGGTLLLRAEDGRILLVAVPLT